MVQKTFQERMKQKSAETDNKQNTVMPQAFLMVAYSTKYCPFYKKLI